MRGLLYRLSRPCHRYRWSLTRDISEYDAPIDPTKTVWVDPDDITNFTGRAGTFWRRREQQVGAVQAGSWDTTGSEFSRFDIHRAFVERFQHGTQWADTGLYRRLEASTEHDADRLCNQYDRLYRDISSDGYRTQLELAMSNPEHARPFHRLLLDEITVDIGRDGEFLLVDGKHRLSIAKILHIERVPAAILTRHEEWMQHVEDVWAGLHAADHPDIDQFTRSRSRWQNDCSFRSR